MLSKKGNSFQRGAGGVRPVSYFLLLSNNIGSSVLVRSRLSMAVQPPIANFPDNPEVGH